MVHERFSGCFVLESRTKLNFSFNFGKRLHGTARTTAIFVVALSKTDITALNCIPTHEHSY